MINIPKGTKDMLPNESYKWNYIKNKAREIARKYNIKEISTPVFEHTELFVRGVGKSSDIVNKEMYTFLDKGERSITLKPEGTAGAVRSFIENSMFNEPMPIKMFYFTPCYRYEKPQAGRLREHHQFGVELFGATGTRADAEILMIATDFYKSLGLTPKVVLNNLGCVECRKNYVQKLKEYFSPQINEVCEDCKNRLKTNPLRILDCKVEDCKRIINDAPKISTCLCDDCKNNFNNLLSVLNSLKINYEINETLVRGLDYYTNLVFEFWDDDGINKAALGGGGRYDNLVEELGGKSTPVVGFGIGLERLIMYMESKNIAFEQDKRLDCYIVSMINDDVMILNIAKNLRDNGISCETDLVNRSVKSQFKYANKINAKFTIILGEDELKNNSVKLKNMDSGEEIFVNLEDLVKKIKEN